MYNYKNVQLCEVVFEVDTSLECKDEGVEDSVKRDGSDEVETIRIEVRRSFLRSKNRIVRLNVLKH